MAASPELSMVAPVLLALKENGYRASPAMEPCKAASPCGVVGADAAFPDCLDCRDSTSLDFRCDTCWTDCASPCHDADCDIPQPCFDEYCADSCLDSTCEAQECTDVTCPEIQHCNATCFDTNCVYDFGDEGLYGGQECGLGQCFGFLPVGQSLHPFGDGQDMLYQCPQPFDSHQQVRHWHAGPQAHNVSGYDYLNDNRHKRRKLESSNDTDFELFSHHTPGNHFGHSHSPSTDSQSPFGSAYESSYEPSTPQKFYDHSNPFAVSGNLAPSYPDSKFGFNLQLHPNPPHLHDIRSTIKADKGMRPPKLAPAPSSSIPTCLEGLSLCSPVAKHTPSKCTNVDHFCHWITDGEKCYQHFSNSKDLDKHVQRAHTAKLGPAAFPCNWENCNTHFKHRGKLNRHVSGAHSKYHAYTCSHTDPTTGEPCARTFCTKEQLKNHETTHTGERKYKCRFCDHTSATKTQHNTHERIHTKEKPYQCPWCGHRSGDSSNLSKHVRNKHPGCAGRAKKVAVEATAATSA